MWQKIPASKLKLKFSKLEHNTTTTNPSMIGSCDSETSVFLDISVLLVFFFFPSKNCLPPPRIGE